MPFLANSSFYLKSFETKLYLKQRHKWLHGYYVNHNTVTR